MWGSEQGVSGVVCMVYGVWCRVCGVWSMVCDVKPLGKWAQLLALHGLWCDCYGWFHPPQVSATAPTSSKRRHLNLTTRHLEMEEMSSKKRHLNLMAMVQ